MSTGITHAAVLAAIHRRCFEEAWSEAALAALLVQPGSSGRIAVCGDPVGFALCRRVVDEMEILTLGVMPDARRQGIATRLLQSVLEGAREANLRRVFLEVAVTNGAALRLYERAGFRPVGQRPRYYRARDGSPVDAVILAWQSVAACVDSSASRTRTGNA